MRFIGSKENLLDFIGKVIVDKGITEGVFCDLFTGTTAVAKYFKRKGFRLITNDNLKFSYVFQYAYIKNNNYPSFENLIPHLLDKNNITKYKYKTEAIYLVLYYLNNLEGEKGFMFENYSDEGTAQKEFQRKYFTGANAMRIDAIRNTIQKWCNMDYINEDEYYCLLASLIEAVPSVSNISGTYGAFLKFWDPRAYKKLTLEVPEVIPSIHTHYINMSDANKLIKEIECDVLYLDPPYNERQYITNYHILETIAEWDNPLIYGKTGLRPYKHQRSRYCQKGIVLEALDDIIANAKATHVLFSYNNEGLMKDNEIKKILSQLGKVEVFQKPYRRFKSNQNGAQSTGVVELLYYVRNTKYWKKVFFISPAVSKKARRDTILVKEQFPTYSLFPSLDKEIPSSTIFKTEATDKSLDKKNQLNDLSGREWVYFLNSVEVTAYSTKGKEGFCHELRKKHPSPKPPQLMKKIIEFFTKHDQWVLDPFMGVGGTLLGCSLSNRNGVGIDISAKYIDIYKEVCKRENLKEQIALVGNSKHLENFDEVICRRFDLILTDPPYGDMQARKKTGESAKRKKNNAPTPFTNSAEDIGNLPLPLFLEELRKIIEKAIKYLNNKKYVVLFTKDFQPTKEYNGLLHNDIIQELSKIDTLYFKGYKIWYDKTITLYPYGYPYAFVPNQLHQFILVFRKEA
ncbi:MAG: DNA adenine methylase [candidate division WOR-3 bacterium]